MKNTTSTVTLKRVWITAISERISAKGTDGKTYAVQQTIYGNWLGYKSGKQIKMFFGYSNDEVSAINWLTEQATAQVSR
jgi:hypothetical protein